MASIDTLAREKSAMANDPHDAQAAGLAMFSQAAWWATKARMWRKYKRDQVKGWPPGKCEMMARESEREVREIALRCEIELQRIADRAEGSARAMRCADRSDRPSMPLVAMEGIATLTGSATRAPARPRRRRPAPLQAHGTTNNVLSFRARLTRRERATVKDALSIVGGALSEMPVMNSSSLVKQYMALQLAGEYSEKFAVLFLDAQHRALAFDVMFAGTLDQTAVYPREVALSALGHGAAAVILAHNHPSGNVRASEADKLLTSTLKAALGLLDVRVLDHVIVGPGAAVSMAEQGLL